MDFGLIVKRSDGKTVIDSSTFTVRFIDRAFLPAGTYTSPVTLSCPRARVGMFVAGSPLTLVPEITGLYMPYTGGNGLSYGEKVLPYLTRMPMVAAQDGSIVCSPPVSGAEFTGNIEFLVLAYT